MFVAAEGLDCGRVSPSSRFGAYRVVYVTVDDPVTVSRADRLPVLDSGILFDGSNKAADGLDVGANMRSSQASPGDVRRALSQVDGSSADTERRPATGLG